MGVFPNGSSRASMSFVTFCSSSDEGGASDSLGQE